MTTDFDYDAVGLKIGIEIHQQLNSATKLFCHCPNKLHGSRNPDFTVLRQQRPVLGEEGEFDKGMLVEFLKRGQVVYEGYYDSTCTYELDETPPFEVDAEALEITLQICALLHMNVIRELHVCRKNYVDGSVPGGFQRTMEVGQEGYISLANGKKIGIENVFLEEDAARRIKTEGKTSYFRVDRLGIPLNEITTSPDIRTPEEAKEAAFRIGLLLRSTNRVKRVIGSTRQDINVSIKDGQRIEIKGVQKLDWIPLLVKFEIQRQQELIAIQNQLKELPISPDDIHNAPVEVSHIFKDTACKFVQKGIAKGQKFTALKLPQMKGIFGHELYPNIRFGTEMAGKVKVLTGLKGLIHSDEALLEKYQFSETEINQLKQELKLGDSDLFILLLAKGKPLEIALDIIVERVKMAFMGVPEETRQANDDGTHIFLRELGGKKRLYPDTDSQPIFITSQQLEYASATKGRYPWDIMKDYAQKYTLSEAQIEELIMDGDLPIFEKTISIMPENPALVLHTVIETNKVLRRDGQNVANLTDQHFITLLQAIKENVIAKEAVEAILSIWTEQPSLPLAEAKEKVGIKDIDMGQIDSILTELIVNNHKLLDSRGRGAMGPLMGDLMQKVGRGSIDGKTLSKKLMQAINSYLNTQKKAKGEK